MSHNEVERIMKATRYLLLWETEMHLPISQWSKNVKAKWAKKYHSRKKLLLKIISECSYITKEEIDAIQALLSQIDSMYLKVASIYGKDSGNTNHKKKIILREEQTCAVAPISTIDLFGVPVTVEYSSLNNSIEKYKLEALILVIKRHVYNIKSAKHCSDAIHMFRYQLLRESDAQCRNVLEIGINHCIALHTHYINDAKYKEKKCLPKILNYACGDYVTTGSGHAKFYVSANNPVRLIDGTLLFFDSNNELGSFEFLSNSELLD